MNPYYEEVRTESEAWFSACKPFSPKALKAFFGFDPCLLAAYCHPHFSRGQFPLSYRIQRLMCGLDQFRAACDFNSVLFMLDEYSDVEDEAGAMKIHDIATHAVKNPHEPRPVGENVLGEVCRQ